MEAQCLPPLGWTAEQRAAVLDNWLAEILRTYPEQTGRFLAQVEDPFRNPAGRIIREGLAALLEQLAGPFDARRIRSILDEVVRLRAVQDFTPSQAVGFLFALKPVLRHQITREDPGLEALERRIDEMALVAFDLYMECREQLRAIRAGEARRRAWLRERMASGPTRS